MRTVALRVAALALLLLLALVSVITTRMVNRLPNSVIYFVRAEETTFTLEGVRQRLDADTPEERLEQTLQRLIQGPSEENVGLSSAFPPGTKVRKLERIDDAVMVDLSADFAQGGGTATMLGRLNQLFYTLTQPADISRVSLHVEGEPVTALGGEGILVPQPWTEPEERTLPVW